MYLLLWQLIYLHINGAARVLRTRRSALLSTASQPASGRVLDYTGLKHVMSYLG